MCIRDRIGFLSGIGFDIEEFGPKNYAVKAFPAYMNYEEAEAFLNDFFDSLDDPGAFRDKRTADKMCIRDRVGRQSGENRQRL